MQTPQEPQQGNFESLSEPQQAVASDRPHELQQTEADDLPHEAQRTGASVLPRGSAQDDSGVLPQESPLGGSSDILQVKRIDQAIDRPPDLSSNADSGLSHEMKPDEIEYSQELQLSEICEMLDELQFEDEDPLGNPQADRSDGPLPPSPTDREFVVQVDKDGMQAHMIVTGTVGTDGIDYDAAMATLRSAGVVYGIKESEVRKVVEPSYFGQIIIVAWGTAPQPGTDSQLNYFFDATRTVHPTEIEDGRVDYYNLNLIKNVQVGDLLVVRIPPTQGLPGKSVLGKELRAKPGKDSRIPFGKNTRLSEDGSLLTAAVSGHVYINSGRVQVDPVFTWMGDVDLSSGNLSFLGSVIVRGSITYGFNVECDGNLEVGGSIDGGSVSVGGHLTVRQGIQGQQRSVLTIKGNVTSRFVENATVRADGDVIIGEGIMHSNIDAGGNVLVGGKKGVIVGGRVRAGGEITAKTIGSPFATPTELDVGIRPERRQYLTELLGRLRVDTANLDKTEKAIVVLKDWEKRQGGLPDEKRILLLKLTRSQFKLLKDVDDMTKEKEMIEKEFEQAFQGKIRAEFRIHPGVAISIGAFTMRVHDMINSSTVQIVDGIIRCSP